MENEKNMENQVPEESKEETTQKEKKAIRVFGYEVKFDKVEKPAKTEKHPKLKKALKKTGKVIGGVAIGVAVIGTAVLVNNAKKAKNQDAEDPELLLDDPDQETENQIQENSEYDGNIEEENKVEE